MINNKIKELRQHMTQVLNDSLKAGMPFGVIELILETLLAEVRSGTEKACDLEIQQEQENWQNQHEMVEGEPVE